MCCLRRNNRPTGIFGGTFNPIHLGHIALARQAYEELGLDKVIIMPSGNPPHKQGLTIASEYDRCNMVRLAIEDYTYMEFSDYEITHTGYSYSALTLNEFAKYYSNIYFIIGADSLFQLDTWYHPETVMKYSTIVAANRDMHAITELEAAVSSLEQRYNARIKLIHMNDVPISSSDIRRRIMSGMPVDGMVSASVAQYIKEHHLYSGSDIPE